MKMIGWQFKLRRDNLHIGEISQAIWNTAPSEMILTTEEDGIHQSLLADRTTKNRHNVSRMLTVLEKQGLLKRRLDPEDARLQRIYLTKKGAMLQDVLVPIVDKVMENIFKGMKKPELENLKQAMDQLSINLDLLDNSSMNYS